jgi:hypothetical protein
VFVPDAGRMVCVHGYCRVQLPVTRDRLASTRREVRTVALIERLHVEHEAERHFPRKGVPPF